MNLLMQVKKMTKSLSVFDIFSGIGGFSIGLEKAGMQTVAFCEKDSFCQKVLKKHWPDVPVFSDISKVCKDDLKTLGPIDIIAGGFPCQDISCAGKQTGINGTRSGLWKEFKRLINELKPKYAIIENVANLRSKGLVTILQDLWEIGYNAEWHCIPASAFGAPHRRDRIWIIAYASCISADRLPIGKKKGFPLTRDSCKNDERGFEQWRIEPQSIPRLKDDRLNPDWVEWLMGFPSSWTESGSRRQRLMALGNAVVPLIPEFLGEAIQDK